MVHECNAVHGLRSNIDIHSAYASIYLRTSALYLAVILLLYVLSVVCCAA